MTMASPSRHLRRVLSAAAVVVAVVAAAAVTTAAAARGGSTPPPPWKDAALRRAACGAGYPGAVTPPGYCAYAAASGLAGPRGIAVDAAGDLLVVERFRPHKGRIRSYHLPPWAVRTGLPGRLRAVTLVPADETINLNHGVAVYDGFLYASNDTSVFRWPYKAGQRRWIGNRLRQVVIDGMPGGIVFRHYTRTLKFNAAGDLFMSIGSRQTDGVDGTPWRSMVKRYPAAVVKTWSAPRAKPLHWQRGETWALGLRNEVGLAFDAQGVLWGVENGNNVVRDDRLGGDITDDNPCEEINRLDKPGAFFGYPYCWSEGVLPAPLKTVTGRQHAWLPFTAPARPGKPRKKFRGTPITNAFCRNPSRVVPPAACLPAHWAPLGMAFQPPAPPAGAAGAAARRQRRYEFPASGSGDAIVLSHGSFSRVPAVGYSVARVRYAGGAPVTGGRGASGVAVIPEVLFGSITAAAGNVTFPNGFRPLDGLFWTDGSFAFTGDKTGEIVLLRYYW